MNSEAGWNRRYSGALFQFNGNSTSVKQSVDAFLSVCLSLSLFHALNTFELTNARLDLLTRFQSASLVRETECAWEKDDNERRLRTVNLRKTSISSFYMEVNPKRC